MPSTLHGLPARCNQLPAVLTYCAHLHDGLAFHCRCHVLAQQHLIDRLGISQHEDHDIRLLHSSCWRLLG